MGLWKVKPDADPAMLKRAAEKVERFKQTVPGCTETCSPLCMCPRCNRSTTKPSAISTASRRCRRGYYILYTAWESEEARKGYEEHPAYMDLRHGASGVVRRCFRVGAGLRFPQAVPLAPSTALSTFSALS